MYIKIPRKNIQRIEIVKTDCKMSLAQVVAKYNPTYAFNGGLYDMKTAVVNPIPLRINGKTIATSTDGYWTLAWNNGSDLSMVHSNSMTQYKNVLACSTMLKDGANTSFIYTSAQGDVRGRTGFGCDDQNIHICVTTDKSGALSPTALRSTMKNAGCKDAIMLDCGGSSQLAYNGKYLQAEKRNVSYWILIWTDNSAVSTPTLPVTAKCPYAEPVLAIKQGSTGVGVKWVQWYLNQHGAKLTVDGAFGNGTNSAVIAFQTSKGLKADGIVGLATRAALKKV